MLQIVHVGTRYLKVTRCMLSSPHCCNARIWTKHYKRMLPVTACLSNIFSSTTQCTIIFNIINSGKCIKKRPYPRGEANLNKYSYVYHFHFSSVGTCADIELIYYGAIFVTWTITWRFLPINYLHAMLEIKDMSHSLRGPLTLINSCANAVCTFVRNIRCFTTTKPALKISHTNCIFSIIGTYLKYYWNI